MTLASADVARSRLPEVRGSWCRPWLCPASGRDRFGGYNNLGGRNSGAHYYGGGRNFGGVRGQGGRRGRGGRHNTDYPHPRHPVPPHQYGPSGAVGAYPNPAHDGLYQTVGGYQHPIGGFFPQPQPMEVNPQQVLMGGHVQQQGGATSSTISGHQAPGSVVPPPQLETGTGKGMLLRQAMLPPWWWTPQT